MKFSVMEKCGGNYTSENDLVFIFERYVRDLSPT